MKKRAVLLISLIITLLTINLVNAQNDFSLVTGRATLNCISGDQAAYESCVQRYGSCTRSESGGVTLICWAEDTEQDQQTTQTQQIVEQVIQNPTLVPTTTTTPATVEISQAGQQGLNLDLETKQGEKARLIFQLIKEENKDYTIIKPKLNINLDPKFIPPISKNVDIKLIPYTLYSMLIASVLAFLTILLIIKDIVKPGAFVPLKSRRGQVFIIGAIIFVIAIYSVVIPYNKITEYPGPQDFNQLSENYRTEYPKVFNYATYDESLNLDSELDEFTNVFLGEARKKDPNFGVLYAYKDASGNLRIVNTLNNKVLILEWLNENAQQSQVSLVSRNTGTSGEICITGTGCFTQNNIAGNFDSSYYSTDIQNFKNIQGLRIRIPGQSGGQTIPGIESFVEDSNGITYTISERQVETIEEIPNVVRVNIESN